MPSFTPISNPSFTSQEDWNCDAESSTRTPKDIWDHLAVTYKGRAMQDYAGMVRDQVDEATQERFEFGNESPDKIAIAKLINDGKIIVADPGTGRTEINFAADLSKRDLQHIREQFLDIKVDPDRRQEVLSAVNDLVERVDSAITHQEFVETPEEIAQLLGEIDELNKQVRTMIQNKQYAWLPKVNEMLIMKAADLHTALDRLRKNNPDSLMEVLDIVPKSIINRYKTALINFVKTHNSFSFSPDLESGLRYRAKEDHKLDYKRGGRNSFTQALLAAYNSPKQQDDPLTFIQETTRIPADRFKKIVETAMN